LKEEGEKKGRRRKGRRNPSINRKKKDRPRSFPEKGGRRRRAISAKREKKKCESCGRRGLLL